MTLSFTDRLNLLSILPADRGSFAEATAVRKMRTRITPTAEQFTAIDMVQTENGVSFNAGKVAEHIPPTEIDFTEAETLLVRAGFDLLEAGGKVPTADDFLDLYERFQA